MGIINNAIAPADWDIYWFSPYSCGTQNFAGTQYFEGTNWWEYENQNVFIPNYYTNKDGLQFICAQYGALEPASTRFAILGNLPGSITLGSATPFTTQYGMPLLYVYNGTASLVATKTATSVSSNGSQATFPFPSSLAQAGYSLAVVNQISGTSQYQAVGTNLLSIASSQTVAGSPFGVAVGGGTENYTNCNWDPDLGQYCWSGQSIDTFPVVSLYSSNQVLIGNSVVAVGANPTAVVTNSSGSASTSYDDGNGNTENDDYTGATIAVVANSGGNTVSILDVINQVVQFDVTVGNRPVALAMSSDDSTVYVANYQDKTVTKVNVNSGAATATVAVGGNPTSVALTSAGTLWVGGASFLTEVKTSNMSVVGTESVSGKTIIALAFSDGTNELIATSVDTNSNVIQDEVAPSSFQPGGAYSTVASHQISSLGSYWNQAKGQYVRAFSSTLSNASSISSSQVGAPPLAVQDGWAVVAATPTGFTITDASGHIVLVSETTPSPVTAIALNKKLNVAYLTMPDSNTLLTVPLPGVN